MRREQGRLREELRLTPGPSALAALAREQGFDRAAVVDPRRLAPWAGRLAAAPGRDPAGTRAREWEWVLHPEGWADSSTILVCCLSCFRREPDDLSSPGDPHARVAPFARAHYYRGAVTMLRGFAARLEASLGIPRRSLRLFSNSRIPEKPLLAASGLGTYGKNGLTIVPGLGSLFVIAGAVIPVPSPGGLLPAAAVDPCGSCRRCMDACPAGAIVRPGVVDPALCLQGAAASSAALSPGEMLRWGPRLYGCQACQDACPHNSCLTETAAPAPGEIGPSLPLRRLLSAAPSELRGLFRGSAMGMSWVEEEALRRNALVAAGNSGDPSLLALVESWCESSAPGLRAAARWARERLASAGGTGGGVGGA
jgi:epoxyqueuosine reductase